MSAINTSYKKFKPALREEFNYSCVYCNIREPENGGAKHFSVDHYKPKKKFPELILEYSNLLYACLECNSYKYNYWPNPYYKLCQYIVLNPRLHLIEDHIDKTNFSWEAKTKQGKWNIERFRLSSPTRIKNRKDRKNVELTIQTLQEIVHQLHNARDNGAGEEVERRITELKEQINTLQSKISGSMD